MKRCFFLSLAIVFSNTSIAAAWDPSVYSAQTCFNQSQICVESQVTESRVIESDKEWELSRATIEVERYFKSRESRLNTLQFDYWSKTEAAAASAYRLVTFDKIVVCLGNNDLWLNKKSINRDDLTPYALQFAKGANRGCLYFVDEEQSDNLLKPANRSYGKASKSTFQRLGLVLMKSSAEDATENKKLERTTPLP